MDTTHTPSPNPPAGPRADDCRDDDYRDDEWWRDHFSGGMAELWHAIVPPERAAQDADYLLARLNLPAGPVAPRVLDLPCGEGRVALALAARNVDVTGLDISAALLHGARAQATAQGLQVRWLQGDMRELATLTNHEVFDAAFCWGDSFGYLDDAGNAAFLRSVRAALPPGGRFAMEMQMVAELLAPRYAPRAEGRVGPWQVRIQRDWHRAAGRMTVHYELQRDPASPGAARPAVERRHASYRIHTLVELQALLGANGFRVLALHGRQGGDFHADTAADPSNACLRLLAEAAA